MWSAPWLARGPRLLRYARLCDAPLSSQVCELREELEYRDLRSTQRRGAAGRHAAPARGVRRLLPAPRAGDARLLPAPHLQRRARRRPHRRGLRRRARLLAPLPPGQDARGRLALRDRQEQAGRQPQPRPGRGTGAQAPARRTAPPQRRGAGTGGGAGRRRAQRRGRQRAARSVAADQRDAVRSHILEERGYEEIATDLECSQAVVRQRVSRGLQTLRVRFDKESP